MPDDNPNVAWQQRVAKEDKVAAKFLLMQMSVGAAKNKASTLGGNDLWDNDWTAPLHSLHRVWSTPSMLPPLTAPKRNKSAGRVLPTSDAFARWGRAPDSQYENDFELEAERRDLGTGASYAQSRRSRKSHRSVFSSASIRKEVEEAVQQEVAKLITADQPSGQSRNRRDRLEELLQQQREATRVKLKM